MPRWSTYSHTGFAALGLACAAVAPVAAGDSYASHLPVVLREIVRDTETGARAEVLYFNEVMTGGSEIVVDEQGGEHALHWDGWKGVFEVDFAIAPDTMPADTLIFARDAIAAVCPSVDAAALAAQPIETVTATLYRVDAQCPDADAEKGQ